MIVIGFLLFQYKITFVISLLGHHFYKYINDTDIAQVGGLSN